MEINQKRGKKIEKRYKKLKIMLVNEKQYERKVRKKNREKREKDIQ